MRKWIACVTVAVVVTTVGVLWATAPPCDIDSNPVCTGNSTTFDGPDCLSGYACPFTYAWGIADNATITGGANSQTVTVVPLSPGTFTLSLTVTDANGTNTSCSQVITNVGVTFSSGVKVCEGDDEEITATIDPPTASVTFDTEDSSIASVTSIGGSGGSQTITVTGTGAGNTQVRALAGGQVCKTTPAMSVRVVFSPDPVKVGIGPTRTSETSTTGSAFPYRFKATVTPPDSGIMFDTSDAGKASVAQVGPSISAGSSEVFILKVTGLTATPVTAPGGDVDVQALLNGNVCKKAKVIVIIPQKIHAPHPQFDGNVVGQNLAVDGSTSPAASPPPAAGNVKLLSGYITFMTITVDDQFDHTLNAIYANAPVTQSGSAINQNMTAAGTYSDPVGIAVEVSEVPKESPPGTPNPSIATFLSAAVPPAPTVSAVQNKAVEVEGNPLNPAIVNRTVTTTPPSHLKIEWP